MKLPDKVYNGPLPPDPKLKAEPHLSMVRGVAKGQKTGASY